MDTLANEIHTGNSKLLLAHPDTTAEKEINASIEPSLRRLKAVLDDAKHHNTSYEVKEGNVFGKLRDDPRLVGVYTMEVILHELSRFKDYTCLDYEILPLRDFTMQHIGLAFAHNSPYTEMFTRIVTERAPFVADALTVPRLSPLCHDHLFPEEVYASASYDPLNLTVLSGAFALWMIFGMTGVAVFVVELVIGRSDRLHPHVKLKREVFTVHTSMCHYVLDDKQLYDDFVDVLTRLEVHRVG